MSENMQHKHDAIRLRISGIVQGVGFRPAIWKLARQYNITGHVLNDGQGVLIDIFGEGQKINEFIKKIPESAPPLSHIEHIVGESINNDWHSIPTAFTIKDSIESDIHTNIVPDASTCKACQNDIKNRNNRRYRYAFNNCTHCGPRLSIIKRLPYDRKNTSMSVFDMCPACEKEYHDPSDRRFHAQATACQTCGPDVWLSPLPDAKLKGCDDIELTQHLLKKGNIIAIKGLGGYHLACDATNHHAVALLRKRKNRPAKPFALMASSIDVIRKYCHVSADEAELLASKSAPIVLLATHRNCPLPDNIAPRQKQLGFMLPYTPLHHLLLQDTDFPLIMTSGNISHQPQCTQQQQAEEQLKGIADYWLHNNRDIVNRLDDSVARIVQQQPQLLRRSRGYAPSPIKLPAGFSENMELVAFGSEMKNTFCFIKDGNAIVSHHIGDLSNAHVLDDYEKSISLYQTLFSVQPRAVAIDKHPEYQSAKFGKDFAEKKELPLFDIQHHHAHIAACMAENNWPLRQSEYRPVLGISLDGLGFGEDGTIWGGEFILADYYTFSRVASLVPVAMPGGTQSILQPWRNTYAQLLQAGLFPLLEQKYTSLELIDFLKKKPLSALDNMIRRKINTPYTSSCGRLFDAVAAAIGICRDEISYEGQAAIELEALVNKTLLAQQQDNCYVFSIDKSGKIPRLQTSLMWQALLDDLSNKISPDIIATRFHAGLIQGIVNMVEYLKKTLKHANFTTVALSGGVFQNSILLEHVSTRLEQSGFNLLKHSKLPANDGGLSLGQAVIALARFSKQQDSAQQNTLEKPICV